MNAAFRHIGWTLGVVLLVICGLVSRAGADGVYIPQRAYPALPTIPVQRAVIVYREGVETLMVESAFQSKSPEVAWILPLPAAPSRLELTEAGAVSSTAYSLRPNIEHDLHGLISVSIGLCLFILPLALISIFVRDPRPRRVLEYLVVVFVLILLVAILLPSLGSARSGSTVAEMPGVSILSIHRLGDADFIVLDAATPEVLDQWLTARGLRGLDGTAKPIVADYIARRWVFVVGTLHNGSGQLAVPRPLMVRFPATTPVFPMKLTALANTTTHVELCVFANEQAVAPGFHCVVADKYLRQPSEPPLTRYNTDYPIRSDYFYAEATRTALGHPDVVPLLWADCTATKLVADLPAAKMDHDVAIEFQPLISHRDTFYSSLARRQIALALFFGGMAVFEIVAAVIFHARRRPTARQSKFLLASFLGVGILAAGVWQFLPTIPVRAAGKYARYRHEDISYAAGAAAKVGLIRKNMTPEEIAAIPQLLVEHGELRADNLTNPFTGEPIRAECSPGNFAVRTIGGKTYFCTYDENGVETRTPLP
jgi:hypothetical protein